MTKCEDCDGTGNAYAKAQLFLPIWLGCNPCPKCNGTGKEKVKG